jgi:hypothetical protein
MGLANRFKRPRVEVRHESMPALFGFDVYTAEIPERWGKRIVEAKAYDIVMVDGQGAKFGKELVIRSTHVKNNGEGRVTKKSHKATIMTGTQAGQSGAEQVEAFFNSRFNHRLRLVRALRA